MNPTAPDGDPSASRPDQTPDGKWLVDWFSPDEFTAHALVGAVYHERSPFQDIKIVVTRDLGRCLLLDGEAQSYEADEHIYHEALVHPALVLHPEPRRVLIVGGGEGATLREVLRHRAVDEVVMAELDEMVVSAAKQHLPTFHAGAFADARSRLVIGDGRAFLEENADTYDAIYLDLNNPLEGGPSQQLFTLEFYESARKRLSPGGFLVVQSGAVTPQELACPATVHQTLKAALPGAATCLAYVPSFCAEWSFVVAAAEPVNPLSVPADEIDRWIAERVSGQLRYYDGETHQRMFRLPKYAREAIAEARPLSRDDDPLTEQFPGYTPRDG